MKVSVVAVLERSLMADRSTLHIKHLDAFRLWLKGKGYIELPLSQHAYEVLRMKKDKNTVVVYRKNNGTEHLSVMGKDVRLVWAFLKERRAE